MLSKDFNFRQVIPNFFTSLNIFFGFLAIIKTGEGDYLLASYFIFVAAIMDTLDGFSARLVRSFTKFGVELDSLADVVSFGLAPSYLIYKVYLYQFDEVGIAVSSIFAIFGAYRLARFNVQLKGFDKNYFSGLPIPSGAITLVSFVILFNDSNIKSNLLADYAIILTGIVAILMISRIKYDTFPKPNLKGIKEKPLITVIILMAIPVLIFTNGKGLFYVFIAMILLGIIRHIINFFKK